MLPTGSTVGARMEGEPMSTWTDTFEDICIGLTMACVISAITLITWAWIIKFS